MLYVVGDSLPKTDFLTHIDIMIIITMGTLVTQGGTHCLLVAGVAGEDMLATTNARIAAGLLGAYTLALAAIFLPARHRYNRQVGEWSADPAPADPAPEEAIRVSANQNFGFAHGAAREEQTPSAHGPIATSENPLHETTGRTLKERQQAVLQYSSDYDIIREAAEEQPDELYKYSYETTVAKLL